MSFEGNLGMSGEVTFEVIRPNVKRPTLRWRLTNMLRWNWIVGWLSLIFVKRMAMPVMNKLRIPIIIMYGELSVRHINGLTGEITDYGVVSRHVITNAAVTFLRDAWNLSGNEFSLMNFHGIGTGTNAENVTDTALQTESTTALNPNNTRATGTRSTPATNQFRSVGTLTCDADIAVTEHGLLSQAATGGGTLWDRSVFAVINLVGANPDSIQCTYTGTITAGG